MLQNPPLFVAWPHFGSLLAPAEATQTCNLGSNTSAFGLSLYADDLPKEALSAVGDWSYKLDADMWLA